MVLGEVLRGALDAYGGELAALAAACLWAFASTWYEHLGGRIKAMEMNLLSSLQAIALTGAALLLSRETYAGVPLSALLLLALSGVIGFGVGNTAYFLSLREIGTRRSLLLSNLTPPVTALIALVALGERLSLGAWAGLFITIGGVTWVITERSQAGTANEKKASLLGVFYGFLAAASLAVGSVISRYAFLETDITPLGGMLVRIIAGTVVVWGFLKATRRTTFSWIQLDAAPGRLFGAVLAATVIGTFLATWMLMAALDLSPAGIVQTLIATSPLFALLTSFWTKERITVRTVLGMFVAIGGIAMLFGLK